MDISASNKKLREAFTDEAARTRLFGAEMAKKLGLRFNALKAADSLAVFFPPKSGPERCHELTGRLKGIFSMDLKHPYRLLLRPTKIIVADFKTDLDRWRAITGVDLTSVEDTHE